MTRVVRGRAFAALAGLTETTRFEPITTRTVTPLIRYRAVEEFPGWNRAVDLLRVMIERWNPSTVFEIGSGANPTLGNDDVNGYGLRYITSDRNSNELGRADPVYEARCVDLEDGPLPPDLLGRCDLIFSRMVNEHIRDGRRYHANIYDMLSPGGVAVHVFSTRHTLPFLVGHLMPARLGNGLFNLFARRDRRRNDNGHACYCWSRGPMPSALMRFRQLGYDVVSYDGYFGQLRYPQRAPLLRGLDQARTRLLLRFCLPLFCSYATVVLRKPVG